MALSSDYPIILAVTTISMETTQHIARTSPLVALRHINTRGANSMAFRCDCCGEYSRRVLLMYTLERICLPCEKAMAALHGVDQLTDRQARDLHVTHEQASFFSVEWVEPDYSLPTTQAARDELDQQAEQDTKDMFG